jgi:mRNA-degrading endonuclease toxin of MazEF toxin-antitoxin module
MKKLLLSMMAIAALTSAEAKKVKFQVDMTGQTISPNGVHVAGNFQAAAGASGNWKPGETALSNGGSGNIYSVIVDIPANAVYEFKYINDNNWGAGEESIPAISKVESAANGGNNGNRWFYNDSIADDTTVLPAIMFGGSAPAGMYAVRIAVDMQKEASISANGVHLAGDIVTPNWTPAANTMANLFPSNKIYEYIAYVSAGTYAYKFVNGNAWGSDESVPSGCQVGNNRQVIVSTANIVTDKVCYASCIACPTAPIPTYAITFQVDMSNSDCDGGYDSVTVTGAGSKLTGFGAGFKMAEIGTSKIFQYTIADMDSGEVKFKFRYHKNGTTNWEGGADRIITHSSADTIDLTCFGSRVVGACPSKPAPSSITFKVDMTNETPGVVYLMGTFQTPNWQAGALRMSPSAGQPGVFEVTVNNICPGAFNYKFVNGDSSVSANEENFPDSVNRGCVEGNGIGGFNRKFTRTSANAVTLSYVFNTCTELTTSVNEIALSNTFKLFPNPAQSFTTLEFNDNATSHDVVVMDITGKVFATYNNQTQNAVTIQTDGLSKGMYFIKATNTRNESVTSKLIVR